ncbi:MAG: pyridoxine 5'-phosphate synthase [Tannerellaceae bacterium]|jgi:pyridoxine 5-phosphate synthase|nr:pyridoxine 5'-phosphate synthase [Tannerellaceae bacterium]
MRTSLSVNINKVATLRNARGGDCPNVVRMAMDCEEFGADGITVHPRPDERHIRRSDVLSLRPLIKKEFNIEGYPSEAFMELLAYVRPTQATLVPDPPEALTSNAGWDVAAHFDELSAKIAAIKRYGIRTSIFVGTDLANIEWAARTGADRIELYTQPYAEGYSRDPASAVAPFAAAARRANELGLRVNAGHDLNLDNLAWFCNHVPYLAEVSIGHALVCDALYYGLEQTIAMYKRQLITETKS